MTTDFLHGVEVIEIDDGPRAIATARSSVIGLVGTAEGAAAASTASLVTGAASDNTGLTWTAKAAGAAGNNLAVFITAPATANADLAVSVSGTVITVSLGTGSTAGTPDSTAAEVMAAVNGHAAASALIEVDDLLTSTGVGVVAKMVTQTPLTGGADAALPVNTPVLVTRATEAARFGLSGTIPEALDAIWDNGGGWVVVVRVAEGVDAAATKTAVIGNAANRTGVHALIAAESVVHAIPRILIAPGFTAELAVTTELVGVAERIKAVVVADGPNTTDADAITYRANFGSDRLYLVDPGVKVWDTATNAEAARPASGAVAGIIAKSDLERGFWWSPSNRLMNGITGTGRAVDFALNDPTARANYLNENEVATIIQKDGYRLWGNRSTSADPKWAFLSVRRTADMIHESLLQSHLWAVDRNITATYVEDVVEGVQAYIDHLTRIGAVIGGRAWMDAELNSPESIAAGRVYIDFEFTPPYPAERITFRSHLVNDYLSTIFAAAA